MDGGDDRFAVVLVEAGPRQHVVALEIKALGDAFPRLAMALQRAGDDGIELHAALTPVLTEANSLAMSEFAQVVIVGSAETGLSVAHEVEGSHARDSGKKRRRRLSLVRPIRAAMKKARAFDWLGLCLATLVCISGPQQSAAFLPASAPGSQP